MDKRKKQRQLKVSDMMLTVRVKNKNKNENVCSGKEELESTKNLEQPNDNYVPLDRNKTCKTCHVAPSGPALKTKECCEETHAGKVEENGINAIEKIGVEVQATCKKTKLRQSKILEHWA